MFCVNKGYIFGGVFDSPFFLIFFFNDFSSKSGRLS